MPVRIITDSASDIVDFPNPNLTVLPLTVAFGNTVYHDGVDLTHERFFELLVESDALPSTGAVAPGAFAQAYDAATAVGEDVVVVTLSSKVSATWQSACIAAEGRPNVNVVDSLNSCIGQRVLVEYSLMLAERGLPAAEVASRLEAARSRVRMLGLLDTLEYLRRGGRIGSAAAAAGMLLSIKPVVTMTDGGIQLLGKARGSKNARNLLVQLVDEHPIDFAMPFSLACTAGGEAMLRKYVRDSRDLWEGIVDALPITTVGATIGTHVGPGAIAVAYFSKDA
ncbi:MAG: DegV family protein [Parafannyhessea sp.]|uniref:DegV family protein n=1 Tax=Parafannyhessea sp. TaxID=2847324 RepID=UPI003F0A5295